MNSKEEQMFTVLRLMSDGVIVRIIGNPISFKKPEPRFAFWGFCSEGNPNELVLIETHGQVMVPLEDPKEEPRMVDMVMAKICHYCETNKTPPSTIDWQMAVKGRDTKNGIRVFKIHDVVPGRQYQISPEQIKVLRSIGKRSPEATMVQLNKQLLSLYKEFGAERLA